MKESKHKHYCIETKCEQRTWRHAGKLRKKCSLTIFAICPKCDFNKRQLNLFKEN